MLQTQFSPYFKDQRAKEKHTSFLATGLSSRTKCVNRDKPRRLSKSANSVKLFEVKTKLVRWGTDDASVGWICLMRFRARRSVWRRGKKGKFPREVMELSVKSIASWSCCEKNMSMSLGTSRSKTRKGPPTFAIPKFSIAGILCPTRLEHTKRYQSSSFQKCSICPFQALCMYIERTSEIQLAIFDRVDIWEGILDEFDGQSHCGGEWSRVLLSG